MYLLHTYHGSPQWDWFSIWVTGFLVLCSIEKILWLTVTPCWKMPFSTKDFVEVWQCHQRIRYKKIQAIGKLKNPTMVHRWRNIKGQVAHHSWSMQGLEGDNGLGATSWTTVIHWPVLHHHWMLLFCSLNNFCNIQHTLLKQILSGAPIYIFSSQ